MTAATQGANLDQWARDGFFVVRGLLDPPAAGALVDAALAVARLDPTDRDPRHVVVPEGNVRAGATAPEESIAKVFKLHRDEPFRSVARDPRILELVAAIAGPDLDVFLSQFIFKWPEAYGQPWHQDSFYFPYRPDRQVGVWVAANRATIANGCLWVLPGSHTEPVHEHVPDDRPNATTSYTKIVDHDMAGAVPVEMEPGDVLVFDSHLMHMSTDNETDDLRAALVCHYSPAGTEILLDYAEHVADWQPVWRAGAPADVEVDAEAAR
jgi:ectoine hydroxylase-related dioxygenase (phytanoyl-CoA dioxygenase family)